MEMMTVSEVSKTFNISTRMLRYYEKMGLILSFRKEDYAYHMYDETALRRLQLIIVLRKLHIQLKQIAVILDDKNCLYTRNILEENLTEFENEINSLNTIRNILQTVVDKINDRSHVKTSTDLLDDQNLITLSETLTLSKNKLKEAFLMNELNQAENVLSKLTNKEVRIIYLPPATVASVHSYGEIGEAEGIAAGIMDKFIRESGLCDTKKDLRQFGFI